MYIQHLSTAPVGEETVQQLYIFRAMTLRRAAHWLTRPQHVCLAIAKITCLYVQYITCVEHMHTITVCNGKTKCQEYIWINSDSSALVVAYFTHSNFQI